MILKNKNIFIPLIVIVVCIIILIIIGLVPKKEIPPTATPSNPSGAKLNINVVCESALAYMSFPDGASANAFVAECKEGKHPEVIEKYKKDMNLGDGAQI